MNKAILFDLDGTLLDTERIYQKYWNLAGKEAGYELTPEQFLRFRSLAPKYARVLMEEMTGSKEAYDIIRRIRQEKMREEMARIPVPVKPHAKEVLTALRENDFTTAVVTASPMELAKEYIAGAGLLDALDRILSAHMVENGKPSPDVYLFACRELEVNPEETYAVEDAPNGVISASDAGCRVIMVPDITAPDAELEKRLCYCAKDLRDVLSFVLSH